MKKVPRQVGVVEPMRGMIGQAEEDE